MAVETKVSQLQIRVSPVEKAAIQGAAQRAGMGMSEWVLQALFPPQAQEFQYLLKRLKTDKEASYVLAEIHDLIQSATASEFEKMVAEPPHVRLLPYWENYVAAMIEYAAHQKGVPAPLWTRDIEPLEEPVFGSDLMDLRLYLLIASPPPFRCRNIFIDASIGQRV